MDRSNPQKLIRGLPLALAIVLCSPARAEIELRLPLDCEPGKTCWVQNYVDHDKGTNARDYTCGGQTYDTHDGTDFRLPTRARMKEGVPVVAAADGRVLRLRDGVPDASVRERGLDAVRGQECGNGVVIGHADGFETQYCHLQQGSISVKSGTEVKAGDPIGRVGLSGRTEFAHVHLTVRKDGKVVDPFAYGATEGACNAGSSLWQSSLRSALGYQQGAVINQGFAGRTVTIDEVDSGDAQAAAPGADAPALIAYVRAIGLKRGDVLRISITGPDGASFADHAEKPLDADKAQYFVMVGRRRPPEGWKPGTYRATYSVSRAGTNVLERRFETAF